MTSSFSNLLSWPSAVAPIGQTRHHTATTSNTARNSCSTSTSISTSRKIRKTNLKTLFWCILLFAITLNISSIIYFDRFHRDQVVPNDGRFHYEQEGAHNNIHPKNSDHNKGKTKLHSSNVEKEDHGRLIQTTQWT